MEVQANTRFLKLSFEDPSLNDYTKDIRLFAKKYPALLIATRSGWAGARLLPLMSAMVLAKLSGFKFGFTWDKLPHKEKQIRHYKGKEFSKLGVEDIKEVFDEKFIKEHSYTGVVNSNSELFEVMNFEDFKVNSVKTLDIISRNTQQILCLDTKKIMILEFKQLFPLCFKELGFNKNLKELINEALLKAKEHFKDRAYKVIRIRFSGAKDFIQKKPSYQFGLILASKANMLKKFQSSKKLMTTLKAPKKPQPQAALHLYADYDEALKLGNSYKFKLGGLFIKAYKNVFLVVCLSFIFLTNLILLINTKRKNNV